MNKSNYGNHEVTNWMNSIVSSKKILGWNLEKLKEEKDLI